MAKPMVLSKIARCVKFAIRLIDFALDRYVLDFVGSIGWSVDGSYIKIMRIGSRCVPAGTGVSTAMGFTRMTRSMKERQQRVLSTAPTSNAYI
jgi:hypothetical protein